ncbi:hypothetical protein DW726_05015 [Streptococcus gordonii]|uniref:DUF5966 family protein n=1 Tax=Streptococcus gordonii TaxID=1302 RepID=UPI000E4D6574|nr:DUF5966 family protein [Streptococcus gordonii]RHE64453.1 hypothetical protein DW726_05015 [Streptococcus gordonii]
MTAFLIFPLILMVVGVIALILWRLLVLASGLLLIGLACAILFTEVYGFYLLFTEPGLYVADLAQNGFLSFTTFFIFFNLALLVLASWAGYKWKRGY